MKRYRYITLSLLLLLLSISALSAQKTSQQGSDKDGNFHFEVTTTPSYCQNEGTMEVKLLTPFWGAPLALSQIERVEYEVKDGEGHSYTQGYKPAPAPTEALLIEQLPGREDYSISIRLIAKEGIGKSDVETFLRWNAKVENKYVALEVTQEKFDAYRLPCRPYGSFHIVARGGTQRPPVLNIKQAPATFTGAKTMQPTKREVKGDTTLYHFEYSGALPQGVYEYSLESACRATAVKSFTIYGPTTNLPMVPSDLKIPFGIDVMSGEGCASSISAFGASFDKDKPELRELFKEINKGYQGDAERLFPEYADSFPSTFITNYEVAVVTQQEYTKLQQGTLDASTLLWSSQTGSLTKVYANDSESGGVSISYTLPQSMSLQELRTQQALPAAVLIRVKRPNEGCNDYIIIPITVDLDFHKNRFEILETEDVSDCSIGQIIWFQGWNFCTLRFKYYELPDGSDKPDPSATPIHTSDDFGPAVSTSIDKRYTFEGYDPTKRYYVEIEGTDLYGNPITPKPSLILAPTNKKPIKNRLYDFSSIYAHLPQPMLDRIKLGSLTAYLSPGYHTYLFTFYGQSLNAMAGMEITLVEAPEGYEEYRRTCESYYFNTPNPTDAENPYGGGMIGLGETIKMSNTFTGPGGAGTPEYFFPFRFIYKVGKNGERVVYPYKDNYSKPSPIKDILTKDPEKDAFLEKHPMPRGIYRLKFEHPCQPGESFYIDLDMSEPDFKPELTELIKPVVDRTSCDEVRVYPFADGRLDYAVDKEGKPRNIIFYVTLAGGQKKWLYFYPKDRDGNPIDHTKFYIPVKSVDLPLTLNLRYFYPMPSWQWTQWNKPTSTSVNPVGVNQFVKGELERRSVSTDYYKLPLGAYDPANDQDDWGEDGFSWSSWSAEPFVPWISVDVPIDRAGLTPSYSRPTYVGYLCSTDRGYMEFKLINIPNKVGTVVLKDGDKVIKSENIADLPEDLIVRWDLTDKSGIGFKHEYGLEITTSPCDSENMPTEKFIVKLEDISEGIAVTISPKGAHCPDDVVTLTASNLGVPDSNYHWTFDNGESYTGRTIRRKVSAPRVVDGKAHYEHYSLTVEGIECSTLKPTEGVIPVSPDELWWMPGLNDGTGKGTLPDGTDEGEPFSSSMPPQQGSDPEVETLGPKYYDWNDPDNWAFLHDRQFYAAKAVPSSCTNVHIEQLSKFNLGTQGTVSPQPDLAKEVTLRDLYGEPTCIDITFHSGAFVYNIQQLNYRRAMVRYNFGVADGTSYNSDKHIYTDKEHDTDEWLYGRNELNLLAAPLHDIYAGDYSFSASPYTYQLGFRVLPGIEENDVYDMAEFDASAFNDPSPLQSISMASNNNSIALIVARDEQGFKSREGKSAIVESRGILELPYFDRPDVAKPFYHQTYDASKGQSRFQYFDGKARRFRGYYSYAQRSKMAYRFIFENPTTQRIPKLANGTESYTMEVNATAAGQEVMVGNPFMTPLQIAPFLDANKEVIEPYVRFLSRVEVKGYDPLKLDGSILTYHRATAENKTINQLEAFVVKLKEGVGSGAKLIFPTTALDSYAKQHTQSGSLSSESGDAGEEAARYLSLTLQSRLGKDRALVTYGYESGSVNKLLMSAESRYPSIAIIDPAGGPYKDLYADDVATGHYQLATRVSEPIDVTLSLVGSVMGHVVTARLIDHKSGLEHDLTGGKSCQIKLFPDDAEGRLELRVDGDFTSVAPMAAPTAELQAQYSEGMLTVRTTQEMSSLRLVQGDGITVYTQSLPGLTEYSERILLSSGSYVVEAIGTDGVARRAVLVVK